ncbi:hypothetical protein M2360_002080 [Rhizobium sp. SG_E_25_P2]|uniref:DUF982 domain-containing protein n=1 Tax=Rhizobium sp. SG_E_25_P2 TaxID=2879942 RepID=UPI002473C3CF|nr:DUF982 domain-containing protein [Rhizobium sp. SG_E_25_P2]MDH6266684.1 hypothetical protein [Rhizobium sp. SG_E_25_P2]
MQANDIPWRQPITVQLQNGAARHFSGAYDALDFLENEWPLRKGRHYLNALTQCRAALCRAAPAEVAREAFIASCIEAALVCHPQIGRAPANANGAPAEAA